MDKGVWAGDNRMQFSLESPNSVERMDLAVTFGYNVSSGRSEEAC